MPRNLLSIEQYPALKETARPGCVAGTIHAVVGTTGRHDRIAPNAVRDDEGSVPVS